MQTRTEFINIVWQTKPANETGGKPNGASIEDVLRTCQRILEHKGKQVPCWENESGAAHAKALLAQLEARSADRAARGVEGTRKP